MASQYKVMPDSFVNYPVLKTLFAYVWKGITGDDLEETFAYQSFSHLLRNGCVEGARDFVRRFPEVLNHESFNPKNIFLAFIQSDRVDLLKFLLEDIVKLSVENFLTSQDFEEAVRICRFCDSWKVLDHLLSNYELMSIDPQVVNNWVVRLPFDTACETSSKVNYILAKYFPDIKKEVEESLLKNEENGFIVQYIKISGISPVEILQKILKKEDGEYDFFDILGKVEGDVRTFFPDSHSLAKILEKVSFYPNLDLLVKRGVKPKKVVKAALTALNSGSHPNKVMEYVLFADFARRHHLTLHEINGIDVSEIDKFLESYITHLFPNGRQETLETLIALGFKPKTIIETTQKVIKDDRFVRYYSEMLSTFLNC
ncbi:MAG: hypothetical protein F9K49_06255 [Caedimonadaceae bacterium]|nr:MAG: hypothetical protein F9K49_06255 [Caedimonadaceae bacterium]